MARTDTGHLAGHDLDINKQYATGATKGGDVWSEQTGVAGSERVGTMLLGGKRTRGISSKLEQFDLLRQMTKGRETIHAPGLSEQEQVIIARMKELAMGDPELGQIYTDFTFRALEGEEGVTPGLRRDIAEQEAITKEEIARGLGSTGDIRSTAGIKRMGRFREQTNIMKERARQDAIRRGEGLIGSRSRRMIAAAGTALGPLAQQRGLESAAQLQTAANVAGEKAGLMRLGGQFGGMAVTQARRT